MGGYNPIDDFSFLKGLGSGLLEADKSQLQSPQDGNGSHCKPSLLFAKLLWLHVLMGRDCPFVACLRSAACHLLEPVFGLLGNMQPQHVGGSFVTWP